MLDFYRAKQPNSKFNILYTFSSNEDQNSNFTTTNDLNNLSNFSIIDVINNPFTENGSTKETFSLLQYHPETYARAFPQIDIENQHENYDIINVQVRSSRAIGSYTPRKVGNFTNENRYNSIISLIDKFKKARNHFLKTIENQII